MDIQVKFKLIDFLYLSPEELSYLDRLPISDNLARELLNDNIDALKSYFEKLQNEQSLDDSFRLFIACLKRRVTPLTVTWNEKEDLEGEDNGEEDYDFYGEKLSEEDKEFFREKEKRSNELWKEREKKFHKCCKMGLIKRFIIQRKILFFKILVFIGIDINYPMILMKK